MAGALIVKREKAIVTAILNRPDRMNALNKELFDEIRSLVDVLETDKVARVLVITGMGDKAFCGGADLKERQGMNEKDVLVRLEQVRQLYLRIEKLPMPVVAAINGLALGGGLELALACDIRVAAQTALLGFPEVELGIIPGNGGTQRLRALVGLTLALELVLTARRLTGAEALELGLVSKVVPSAETLAAGMEIAHRLSELGPIALRQAKAAIRGGAEKRWEEALAFETEMYKPCLYSKDRLEALKAFGEKRKPEFRGE